jgi:hypothetical protein
MLQCFNSPRSQPRKARQARPEAANAETGEIGTYRAGVLRQHGRGHENLTAPFEWRLVPRHLQRIAAPRPFGADTFCVGQFGISIRPMAASGQSEPKGAAKYSVSS